MNEHSTTALLPDGAQLDAQQQVIAGLGAGTGPVMVWGGPGSGRTTAVVSLAARRLEAGLGSENVLILTPSRVSAARTREQLAKISGATLSVSPVRAWQAYAFDLLQRAHRQGLLPGVEHPPKLLSGPEQDVVIRELMDGHARGLGSGVVWPPELGQAVGTRGFRSQMRDLFDRLSEHDMSPDQLRSLARQLHRPHWEAVACFREEYQAVRRLRMPETFDAAALVTEAAKVLENNPHFLAEEQQRFSLVIVDDLQEATYSIHRLLKVLCAGQDVVVTACPDTVVQGFRGARPDVLRTVGDAVRGPRGGIKTVALQHNYRMGPNVYRVWQQVAQRIPAVTPENFRDAQPQGEQTASVQAVVLASAVHEARWIGADILRRHLVEQVPLRQIAVIVRHGAMLQSMQRHLESLGIAVSTSAAETPVRDEPAVKPLLAALHLVVRADRPAVGSESIVGADAEQHESAADYLDAVEAVELLTSRIGGATPMEIRRLRQRLRHAEFRAGGGRNSDRLLVEALTTPGVLEVAKIHSPPARRVARMLHAGRQALTAPNATAQTVLWAIWEAAGVASAWRKEALSDAHIQRRANRDLDAVVGLFEMAERFVDHLPGAGAAEFLDFLQMQELPMDTLAARAPSHETVHVMTPATAAGNQWPVVYVAGLQQGQWPNTTVRGQLFDTDTLTDAVEFGVDVAQQISAHQKIQGVIHDELRSFSTAVSRASHALVVTAVSDQDSEPSEFLGLVDPWEYPLHPEAAHSPRPVLTAPRPLTLRELTAQLRAAAQSIDSTAPTHHVRAEAAARLLHQFAQTNPSVPGAAPGQWWGLTDLSTQDAVVDPEQPVPISPSRVEMIHRNPLDWWVSVARAEQATDPSRSLGTLVHSIAETAPDAPSSQLIRELHRRWPELGVPETWESVHLKERAENMLRKFADYVIRARKDDGRQLVAVEGSFAVLITGGARDALLRGRVDRLEIDDQGRYVVVDLKTGKSAPTRNELEKHPQLGAYQVALAAGAGAVMAAQGTGHSNAPLRCDLQGPAVADSGGAVLVQLGKNTVNVSVQTQDALSHQDTWAKELVSAAADLVSGQHFMARHSAQAAEDHGQSCALPRICPLCSAGRQVTE